MNTESLEAATKAAYPELWPDNWNELPPHNKASLAYHRQAAMERARVAIESYAEANAGAAANSGLAAQEVTLALPDDAAMIQQVLATITYIDHEGATAYVVRTMGEGLRTTWLGMNALTQDYLLKMPGVTGWNGE
jgi:phage tail protein X